MSQSCDLTSGPRTDAILVPSTRGRMGEGIYAAFEAQMMADLGAASLGYSRE